MPEPISTLGLMFIGCVASQPFARRGTAVSAEADDVSRAAFAVVSNVERSESLFGDKSAVISQLWQLHDECSEPDWDGNDAMPLSEVAVATAIEFIKAIPTGMPLPEVAPEPEGAISLDWIASRTRRLTVSVKNSTRLAYAWMDGTDRGHAVARFDGGEIPARILQDISSIVQHDNLAFRTA